jgi:prepilin-type N-terminal cleavage/methylation domain-containing protein
LKFGVFLELGVWCLVFRPPRWKPSKRNHPGIRVFNPSAVGSRQYVDGIVIIITRLLLRPRRQTERTSMKLTQANRRGFTLVEIMIVVAIIGMLASIAIPNYIHAREKAHQAACISNLRQIEGAVATWALETGKQSDQAVQYSDISGYLSRQVICPAGGSSFNDSYQVSSVDAPPVCLRVTSGKCAHKLQL